jgi:predicted glycosyltransferase involved in capsule biosynthesis
LRRYYAANLPNSEIVIGRDRQSRRRPWRRNPKVFSKAAAVNNAFRKSGGDIVVILDADAYLSTTVLTHCADRLRAQRRAHVRGWFIPYSSLYRINRRATREIIKSDPRYPLALTTPPPAQDVEGRDGSGSINTFGAMCQVMPREAFETVGGMDPRFRSWGSEDSSFMHALDTLWGRHATTPNDILHLWHPRIMAGDGAAWTVRLWPNQTEPNLSNALGARYAKAAGKPNEMRRLVDEGH